MITNLNIDVISDASIPDSKLQERYVLSTTPPNDEIWYTTTDGNVVPFNSTSCGANVVSNTYVNGKGVIKFDGEINAIIDEPFRDCTSLTSITIPDSVTRIGYNTFYGCTSLTSVTIPNSVTDFGSFAFCNCTSLTSVTIPDRMTSISSSVFHGCTSLTSITIPDSVTDIGSHVFINCTSLTSITIPNSVTSIGESAFQDCTSLTSVTIGNSVTSIGVNAFDDCTGELIINSKIVENNYTSDNYPQKDGWLKGAKFTKLTIGDSVTKIGNHVFDSCTTLKSVTIGDSVTSIENNTFYRCYSLKNITIPDSVTSIGHEAFAGCSSLSSITIPDSVTSIENNTFYRCYSLKNITIPDSVTSIGHEAFAGCSMKSITIPDSVTSIGWGAFTGCSELTNITIGRGVTEIGLTVITNCDNLKTVYCKPTTPPSLSDPMLIEMGIKTYVLIDSVDAYKTATYWSDFPDHIIGCVFEDENLVSGENIKTINGESILGEGNIELNIELGSKNFPSDDELWYTSPMGETYIPDDAFGSNQIISHTYENGIGVIRFKEILTEIADGALNGNPDIVGVYIPEKVTYIGRNAFNIESLTDVFMGPKTAPELYDAYVFGPWSSSSSNLKIWIPNDSLISYAQSSDAWMYYATRSKGYIKGGENLIPGKNISTINGRSIIGSADFKLVTKNANGYVEESLIPSTALELGSSSNPWYYVHVKNLKGHGEFLVDTNGDDWSLGTPTEGNEECNISGEGPSMLLKSKDIIIRGKEGVTITDDGYMGDITLSSYTAVNIVAGDEGSGQGTINVTPGAVMVDGYFYCTDNFEVNTNGECYATAFYETSDENLKDFTDDITVDFNKLKEIRKSYFTWKDGDQNLHIGTSAQDIQKVYPELVSEDNKGNLTVDYAKLSIIALSAIDKLDERLSRIENILNKEE